MGQQAEKNQLGAAAICLLLLLAVIAVYGQTGWFAFTDCDDPQYVTDNPQVKDGLTAKGVVWAFTESHASNWHPLTWLSLMIDCQIYGPNRPGGFHLTNLLLHAANVVLLFVLLLRSIGLGLWTSGIVAALFAIHPLHVESVAWVCERKDVLSGLFFLLTLLAYVGYARRKLSLARYLLVTTLFGLGLLAKPMLVTLPLVLLLLDYWPLDRFGTGWRLVWEKLPWFVMSAGSCVATFLAQQAGNAVVPLGLGPISVRFTNAIVAYAAYLGQLFWPVNLAVLYPHQGPNLPIWKIAVSSLVLIAISIAAVVWRRRHPYLLVGWLWYLGMLVPVIGLVQVGGQAMADRYTYLTQIGLTVAIVVSIGRAAGAARRRAFTVGWSLALTVLTLLAWRQTSYWQNTETLLRHALASTSRNWQSHRTLAAWLERHGQTEEAIFHYEKASDIDPMDVGTQNHIGMLLRSYGRTDAAIAHFGKALALNPNDAESCNNMGLALVAKGRPDLAIIGFQKALAANPNFAAARGNLEACRSLLNRNNSGQ
jgi:Flp pilus assembly protein TadD